MNHLEQLQKDAGLEHCPTELTYQLRLAVEGEPDADDFGSYAYEWTDKPHRLVFAACQEIERQAVMIAELEAQVPKVVKPILFAGDFVCECRWIVNEEEDRFRYCAGCGAKLDWSES